MTVILEVSRARGLCHQLLMVILINIPTISLGLAMGWVSLASGEGGSDAGAEGARVVVAAATTFMASLVGVPLSARALLFGRKFAIIATSACFVVCWSLKLVGGGWWLVAARIAAGLGGAGAYSISPLVAREMCEKRIRGAAASALILAHNIGFLLMYLAADFGVPHKTVLWCCLGLSLFHCAAFLLVPESPAFLAANNRHEEASKSMAWLRGMPTEHPALAAELAALPIPQEDQGPFTLLKDMLSDRNRRRAFIISFVAVVGQEACGVYTLMQFAERAFVLTRDNDPPAALALTSNTTNSVMLNATTGLLELANGTLTTNATNVVPAELTLLSPARQAVILGVVQLLTSAVALYLVEKVGRRRLLVTSAFATCLCLGLGAGAAWWGHGMWAAAALAGAVAADNAGLQPAPYALMADMFHYQYRSCAVMLASAATCIANALEVVVFPALAAAHGLPPALLLAALLTAAYALFALLAVPETRGLTPEQVYQKLAKSKTDGSDKEERKDSEPMCEKRIRGAAASALILAHNIGFLLMYLAADFGVPHKTVLWCCLGLSLFHCAAFLLVPESPAFLAANNRHEEASKSMAWLRGMPTEHPALAAELAALPIPQEDQGPFTLLKDMLSDRNRRRAFIISFVAVVGQEACGVYTLMQFAERAFVLTRDNDPPAALALTSNTTNSVMLNATTGLLELANGTLTTNATNVVPAELTLLSPARQAVILGVVQLVTSAVALYLVEKVGRRRLLVTSAFATCLCLGLGAGAAWWGHGMWAAAALAGAVAADNAGLQPAPYALMADMFHYQYRSCAVMLASAATCIANALEVVVFPALAAAHGLPPALLLAALLTAAYALFALLAVPETRGLTPEQVYQKLAKNKTDGSDKEVRKDSEPVSSHV